MDWSRQCAVVIPCLNEAAAIESVVRQVREYLPTIFVVDDHPLVKSGPKGQADLLPAEKAMPALLRSHAPPPSEPRGEGE